LLDAVTDGIVVRLSLLALPEVPRSEEGQRRIDTLYSTVRGVPEQHLDGVIVTGAEPVTDDLTHEPYWNSLTRLLDWAEHNTRSSIWSCLAAHAAVLHLDGIRRQRLRQKLSGVFECVAASNGPLTTGFPTRAWMPHSRWNDVAEPLLQACGYETITRSPEAGVDVFAKKTKSLLVFLQGHPEYETGTLLLEYRRDIRRFLCGETDVYPVAPRLGLNNETAAALCTLRETAIYSRRQELLADFPADLLAAAVRNTWRPAALNLFRNWLLCLCARKAAWLRSRQGQRGGPRARALNLPIDLAGRSDTNIQPETNGTF
jgi:homoserine O-succinyltransferase